MHAGSCKIGGTLAVWGGDSLALLKQGADENGALGHMAKSRAQTVYLF